MRKSQNIGTLLCATVLPLLFADPCFADCATYSSRIDAALVSADHNALKTSFNAVGDCLDAEYRDQVGRHVAQRLLLAAGDSPSEASLSEILQYSALWQALAMEGDIAQKKRDYTAAAIWYQKALLEINDEKATPTKPPDDLIRTVEHKAEEAGLLADNNVPTPRGRGDENEGLAAPSIRGVTITKVAFPVQFVFAKSEFTEQGLRAAADMAAFLKNESPSPAGILLVGHTDRVGTDQANLALSLARAAALAQFLQGHGVRFKIEVEGHGSREPYQADDRQSLTQAQIDQMDRRVELIRG